jgi:hypothetical protein
MRQPAASVKVAGDYPCASHALQAWGRIQAGTSDTGSGNRVAKPRVGTGLRFRLAQPHLIRSQINRVPGRSTGSSTSRSLLRNSYRRT